MPLEASPAVVIATKPKKPLEAVQKLKGKGASEGERTEARILLGRILTDTDAPMELRNLVAYFQTELSYAQNSQTREELMASMNARLSTFS